MAAVLQVVVTERSRWTVLQIWVRGTDGNGVSCFTGGVDCGLRLPVSVVLKVSSIDKRCNAGVVDVVVECGIDAFVFVGVFVVVIKTEGNGSDVDLRTE